MLENMDFEWAPSLGRDTVTIVKAGVSFDAWMIGVLFKGLTFSGRFFEMIIRHLAAGGAAVLLANGVNQSQMWAPHVDSPDLSCQFLATVRLARKSERRVRGWRAAGCSRKGNSFAVEVVDVDMYLHKALNLAELNQVFVCTSSPCVVFPWWAQVCVITTVIRPGYGPPASD